VNEKLARFRHCTCARLVRQISVQMGDLRQSHLKSREEMENVLRREIGSLSQSINPFVHPTVRVGDNNIPIKDVEGHILGLNNTLTARDKTIAEKDGWCRRVEVRRDQLFEENKSLRRELEASNREVANLRGLVGQHEARINDLQRSLENEQREAANQRQMREDEEEERQRQGRAYYGGFDGYNPNPFDQNF
jgi:uncharacterized protein YhaN